MKIIIVIPKKPKLEVLCRPNDPLSVVKNQIFTAYGLFANFYRLYFDGLELDNSLTMLKDYGLEEGSVISLFHWNQLAEVGQKKIFRLKSDNCE
jgi:Ubiquitin family